MKDCRCAAGGRCKRPDLLEITAFMGPRDKPEDDGREGGAAQLERYYPYAASCFFSSMFSR